MNKTCKQCKIDFEITQDDLGFYEKMKVPAPSVCPDCRFKLRALFRNETTLYSGQKCGLCEKSIVTMYNPKSPYTIYCHSCFYSDKWNPQDYAMDYDLSKPFLNQLKDFLIQVPKISTYLSFGDGENFNSEYTNMVSGAKNCYFVFNSSPIEEVMFSRGLRNVRDSSDLYFGVNLDRCYECVNVQESSGVVWGQNIVGSVNSYFLLNCSGLTDCFGCVNLRNKSYCWFNEQLSKEEYKQRLEKVLGSFKQMEEMRLKFQQFILKFPMRENTNLKTVDSNGDYLFECKNVHDSMEAASAEDCKYIFSSKGIKDSLGTTGYGTKCERVLEVVATGYSSNVIGTYGAENSRDILYGYYISNCHDCIACDALKNGEYCILNKSYSKEEYEKLRAHIIQELTEQDVYGLIMPPELAPFAYNETIAHDNMPMTKEEVIDLGFRWEDDIQVTYGKETIGLDKLEDSIQDTSENILSEVLACSQCSRNYKITSQELLFYKKMMLPIPRICFYCRHKNRIDRRGPYKFWNRLCDHCHKTITTNYAPGRPEIIYCESCYQKEVI